MSDTSGLGRAALVVSGGILISRLLGFARTAVLNGVLGLGTDNDLYVAAFAIPDWLFFLMAGGYLSITLVPILSRHLADDDPRAAHVAFTAVSRIVVAIMATATLVLILAAGPITGLFFPSFGEAELTRLTAMMRVTFGSQLFFVAGTLLMAVQYSVKRFGIPVLAPIVYNLGIIGGGAVGAVVGEATPEAFVWGGLAGAILGNFALQWWGARRSGFRLERGVPLRHPAVPEYFGLAFPLMIGQSVVALDEQWPRLFGQLAGEGAPSGLTAARQLSMVAVGVIAQAAGVASYPFLARLAAEGRTKDLRATVLRSVHGAVAVAALAASGVLALAVPFVRLAYQRGSFTGEDTAFVASMLAVYALSIPAWAAHQVYTRGFYAQRRMWLPVGIGTAVTVVTVPMLYLAGSRSGAVAIAWVSTASIVLYTLLIAGAWHREGETKEWTGLLWVVARLAIAAGLTGVTVWSVGGLLDRTTAAASTVSLVAGAAIGVVVFVAAGRVLRLDRVFRRG